MDCSEDSNMTRLEKVQYVQKNALIQYKKYNYEILFKYDSHTLLTMIKDKISKVNDNVSMDELFKEIQIYSIVALLQNS